MKIAGDRFRCDCCLKLEDKKASPIVIRGEKSSRPPQGSRDRFFDIVLPPSVSPVTGKPDGRYKGMAREDQPNVLLPAHLCPSCAVDIRKVVKFDIGKAIIGKFGERPQLCDAIQIKALGDPMLLKPGPMREHLLALKSRNVFPTMGRA